ncbi:pancreatic secretory granule membrane major glycoprotein GP2-like [Siphateles boraxobius]|uniref:pancreatic secretory granule membrane major glycoprotein GP2-like n=1 Tax=Siphateles boraxobius TaxID=180520 RepID=UPI004062F23D
MEKKYRLASKIFWQTVPRLRRGKQCPTIAVYSGGVDEIRPEYLKSLDVVGLSWLTRLCSIAWRSGTVPLEWRVCSNYRGITLLSLPGKVYARVLERRIRPIVEPRIQEEQCGFRPGRGTLDQLYTLYRVLEGSWEFAQPIHMCFVDLEKAFDCVPRGGLYAAESCASSTGSISLSRCQLFESGFYPEHLHLNDPSCTGTLEDGRLLFHFDNEGNICGTTLMSNRTHFIYQNSIQSNPTDTDHRIISRKIWMNMTFSCAYPLIQTISMPTGFRAEGGVISEELPAGQGTYQIRMIPYHDAEFTSPYDGEVQMQVNQQIYVAVEVEGVDRNQIATVLDNCWATPVNDAEYHVRWNLIVGECPNPEDTTVEVLQNGFGTTSHFSFRMFTFSGISDNFFLHCQVHLCLVQNGRCALLCDPGYRRRRHRSLDFLHSSAISMGLKAQ